jgi:vacuolar protein sorting-associated protein VTA1
MRANKVTKQTADTFVAAATFLELLGIWPPVEAEMTQKVKFAKYHALRILNAYKAGEDPNAGNPKIEADEDAPVLDPLDPADPEVQALNGQTRSRQPSVVEASDEADVLQARLARQSSLNESLHPSRAPSAPPPNVSTSRAGGGAVSPLPNDAAAFYKDNQQHSPVSPDGGSSGGNYFPRMPSPTSSQAQPNVPPTLPSAPTDLDEVPSEIDLPSAPPDIGGDPGLPAAPTTFAPAQPPVPRTPLDSFQAPSSPGHIQPPFASIQPNLPQVPHQPHMLQPGPFSPTATAPAHVTAAKLAAQPTRAPTQPAYTPAPPPPTNYADVDEEHILQAQKHARWAISALNFEDVPTAVKEFQSALRALGAG